VLIDCQCIDTLFFLFSFDTPVSSAVSGTFTKSTALKSVRNPNGKGHCQVKGKKNDATSESTKRTKSKPVDPTVNKHCDKQSPPDQVRCLDCDCHITDDTRALNCEKCGKSWTCSICVGICPSTYDDLVSDAGKELHWFCELCQSLTQFGKIK